MNDETTAAALFTRAEELQTQAKQLKAAAAEIYRLASETKHLVLNAIERLNQIDRLKVEETI